MRAHMVVIMLSSRTASPRRWCLGLQIFQNPCQCPAVDCSLGFGAHAKSTLQLDGRRGPGLTFRVSGLDGCASWAVLHVQDTIMGLHGGSVCYCTLQRIDNKA